jgi:hypothetical protein
MSTIKEFQIAAITFLAYVASSKHFRESARHIVHQHVGRSLHRPLAIAASPVTIDEIDADCFVLATRQILHDHAAQLHVTRFRAAKNPLHIGPSRRPSITARCRKRENTNHHKPSDVPPHWSASHSHFTVNPLCSPESLHPPFHSLPMPIKINAQPMATGVMIKTQNVTGLVSRPTLIIPFRMLPAFTPFSPNDINRIPIRIAPGPDTLPRELPLTIQNAVTNTTA